jgi:hypothetical protein
MKIAEFADMTYGVLEGTPFDEYIPTLFLPGRRAVHALEGVPASEEENLRAISLDWALKSADETEEFLVAFRDGPGHFRIIHRVGGEIREALFPAKKPNQLPDPTTPSVTPPAGAGGAPSVGADH